MNMTKIYVKGSAGFKPAVKAKLGDAWMTNDSDKNVDIILSLMTSHLDDLKASIGEDLISAYELQFFTNEHDAFELSKGQRSASPLKMSIWRNEHPNVRANEIQMPQQDPGASVF
jgi:hypothetical protein